MHRLYSKLTPVVGVLIRVYTVPFLHGSQVVWKNTGMAKSLQGYQLHAEIFSFVTDTNLGVYLVPLMLHHTALI